VGDSRTERLLRSLDAAIYWAAAAPVLARNLGLVLGDELIPDVMEAR
jgi:hypothetical protein